MQNSCRRGHPEWRQDRQFHPELSRVRRRAAQDLLRKGLRCVSQTFASFSCGRSPELLSMFDPQGCDPIGRCAISAALCRIQRAGCTILAPVSHEDGQRGRRRAGEAVLCLYGFILERRGSEETHGPRAVRIQYQLVPGFFARTGGCNSLAFVLGYAERNGKGSPGAERRTFLSRNASAALSRALE